MVLYGPWMDRVLSKRITMPYIVHFKSPVSWTVFVVQRGHIKIRGGGGGGGGERERENRNCLTKSREKMTRLRVSLLEWSINSHSPTGSERSYSMVILTVFVFVPLLPQQLAVLLPQDFVWNDTIYIFTAFFYSFTMIDPELRRESHSSLLSRLQSLSLKNYL